MKRIKSFRMYERLGVPEGNVELGIALDDYILANLRKLQIEFYFQMEKLIRKTGVQLSREPSILKVITKFLAFL